MEAILAIGGLLILTLLVGKGRGRGEMKGMIVGLGVIGYMGWEGSKGNGVIVVDSMSGELMGIVGLLMIWGWQVGTGREGWWIMIGGLGGMLVIGASNMLVLYMAVELQALSGYVLIGQSGGLQGKEGALKYYIIGGISTGLVIYGSSMMYKGTGETAIGGLTEGGVGRGLVTLGLLMKLAGAPMHMWAPDVYEGAPMGGLALISTIGKVSIVGAMVHVGGMGNVMMVSGVLSMVYGVLGALNQSKMKRLLGYSGIGNMGYVLIGLSMGTYEGLEGALVYMVIYVGLLVGAMTVMNAMGQWDLKDYIGKGRENGVVGLTVGVILLAMAGVPPLMGFIGKWLIIGAMILGGYWMIGVIGGMLGVISAMYYIRVMQVGYFEEGGWEWGVLQRTIRGVGRVGRGDGVIIGGSVYMGVMGIWLPKGALMLGKGMIGVY